MLIQNGNRRNGRLNRNGANNKATYTRTYLSSRSQYNNYKPSNKKRNNGWMKAGWTSWGRWSACSQTCGTGGVQSRRRFCGNATYGAQSCPHHT